MNARMVASELGSAGFTVARGLFPSELFDDFRAEVAAVADALEPGSSSRAGGDPDRIWMELAGKDRKLASKLYDALKHSVALRKFSVHPLLLEIIRQATGGPALGIVDINFRIDAPGEDHFLFSWHQDYWFSICSPKAVVAWIPMTDGDDHTGGIEVMPLAATGGRILKARRAEMYRSYSDSILLDEPLPEVTPLAPALAAGDAALFTFDLLHRSRPNRSSGRCRWTAQLRFANFSDPAFKAEDYRPGTVTREHITYLDRIEREGL